MSDIKLLLVFSLVTGDIYTIESDEFKNLDRYQIPLHSRPSASCKRCYGRMYTGFNTTLKVYDLCSKCVSKHVDFKLMKTEHIEIGTVKHG